MTRYIIDASVVLKWYFHEPYAFDAIQGAWWETTIPHDAKAIVRRSADRYIRALAGEMP